MNQKTSGTSANSGTSSISQRDEAALALKSSVKADAHGLTEEAKHIAGDLAGQAKKSAESGLNMGKKRAVDGLEHVAKAIRKTGEHLRAEDDGTFTQYFDKAAEQVDVASNYLQTRTLGQLIGDVEHFARREPALFLGGAFVAGLLGGRFLKSSRPQAAFQAGQPGSTGRGRMSGPRERSQAQGERWQATPQGESDGWQEFPREATGVRSRDGNAGARHESGMRGTTSPTGGETRRDTLPRTEPTGNPSTAATPQSGATKGMGNGDPSSGSSGAQKGKASGEGSPRTPGNT